MTYWYKLKCLDCDKESEAIVTYNGYISLYPLTDEDKHDIGKFIESHVKNNHTVVILNDPE